MKALFLVRAAREIGVECAGDGSTLQPRRDLGIEFRTLLRVDAVLGR
jgi:hypothetical protein